MSLKVIQSIFEDIRECIERVKTYSSGLNNADDLVLSTEGILKLDAILMRL